MGSLTEYTQMSFQSYHIEMLNKLKWQKPLHHWTWNICKKNLSELDNKKGSDGCTQYHEIPDIQAGFRKGRRIRDQIANNTGSLKKQESSRKTSISDLLTTPEPLTVWITINCGKFWERWEYQTTWPASWEIYMQVRKQQLELDMEQQTGFQ